MKRFSDSLLDRIDIEFGKRNDYFNDLFANVRNSFKEFDGREQKLATLLHDLENKTEILFSKKGLLQEVNLTLGEIVKLDHDVSLKMKTLEAQDTKIQSILEQITSSDRATSSLQDKLFGLQKEYQKILIRESEYLKSKVSQEVLEIVKKAKIDIAESKKFFEQGLLETCKIQKQAFANLNAIASECSDGIHEIQNRSEGMQSKIMEQFEKRENIISGKIDKKLQDAKNEFAWFSDKTKHLESMFQKSFNEYAMELQDAKDFKNRSIKEFQERLSKLHVGLQDSINQETKNIHSKMLEKEKDLLHSMQNIERKNSEAMQFSFTTTSEDVRVFEKKINDTMVSFDNKLNGMQKQIQDFQGNLKLHFEKEVVNLLNNFEEEKKKIGKEIANTSHFISSFLDSEKQVVRNKLNMHFNELTDKCQSMENKLGNLNSGYNDVFNELDSMRNNFEQKLLQTEEMSGKRYEVFEMEFGNQFVQQKELLGKKMVLLNGKVEDFFVQVQHNLEQEKENWLNFYGVNKKDVQDKTSEFDVLLQSLYRNYVSQFQNRLEEFRKKREEVENENIERNFKIFNATKEQLLSLSQELRVIENKIEDFAKQQEVSMSNEFQNNQKAWNNMVRDARNHWLKQNQEDVQEWNDKLDVIRMNIKRAEEMTDVLSSKWQKQLQDNHLRHEQDSDRLMRNFQDTLNLQISQKNTMFENFNKNLEQVKLLLSEDVDSMMKNVEVKIKNLSEELSNKMYVQHDRDNKRHALELQAMHRDVEKKFNNLFVDVEMKIESLNSEVNKILNYDLPIEEFNNRFNVEIIRMGELLKEQAHVSVSQVEGEVKHIKQECSFIQERIDEFAKESRLFKKGERFFEKLKAGLDESKQQLFLLTEKEQWLHEFLTSLNNLSRKKELSEAQLKLLQENQERLEHISKDMDVLTTAHAQIQNKNQELQEVKHNLDNVVKLKNDVRYDLDLMQQLHATIKNDTSNLNQIQEDANNLCLKVQSCSSQFAKIEESREQLVLDVDNLNQKIFGMEKTNEKFLEFSNKFNQMDELLLDVNLRIKHFSQFKRKVMDLQVQFDQIQNITEDKIEQLKLLLQKTQQSVLFDKISGHDVQNVEGKSNFIDVTRRTLEKRVCELYAKGMDISKIGSLLDLNKSEVKLMLNIKNDIHANS